MGEQLLCQREITNPSDCDLLINYSGETEPIEATVKTLIPNTRASFSPGNVSFHSLQ